MDNGLFSGYKAPPGTRPATPDREAGAILSQITPAQRDAAIAELRKQGMPVTAVNIAEMAAIMAKGAAAPAPAAAGSVARPQIGAQPSEDLLARAKAAQDARNAEVLRKAMAERRRLSGAR